MRKNLIVLKADDVYTVGGAEITLLEFCYRQESTSVGCHTVGSLNAVDYGLALHCLCVANHECRVAVVGLVGCHLLAYDIHVLAADSGIAAGCAKLYGLTVHGDRQTIIPVAVVVEEVHGSALAAEATLIEHEYAVGVFLLLCRGICGHEQAGKNGG